MATRSFPRREEFDRSRDFIVTRPLRIDGKDLDSGQPFDKTLTTTRRLRQLYDGRKIHMAPAERTAKPKKSDLVMPDFSNLPEPALRDWLEAHGVTPRVGHDQKKLAARARKLWEEKFADKKAA